MESRGLGNGWLKVRKVAHFLDCRREEVYDLVHEGELQAFRFGQVLRISVESLEAFIERHRIKETG